MSMLMVVGDAAAFVRQSSIRPDFPAPSFQTTLSHSGIDALLSGTGSFRMEAAAVQRPLLIHIQDLHGHGPAQKSIREALGRLISGGHAGVILLEGLDGNFDAALFRSSPDRDFRNRAVTSLFEEGALSGAAAAVITADGATPLVSGLEDPVIYEANLAEIGEALRAAPAAERDLKRLIKSIERLKKRTYNANLFLVDLALTRYEDGLMPLASLLALLHHRGAALDPVIEKALAVETFGLIYNASEVGSEIRSLLDRMRGRLDANDLARLFDAAYRHQKGTLEANEFVLILEQTCRAQSIDFSDLLNLRSHVDHLMAARALSTDELYAAVGRLRQVVLEPLATSPEEREVLALDRRARLLTKLSRLSLSPQEWGELSVGRPFLDGRDTRRIERRLAAVEHELSAAKRFYGYAERRNDVFAVNIRAAASRAEGKPIIVVAGGFHADAIKKAAQSLGRRTAIFTPSAGDMRRWDVQKPLRDLADQYAREIDPRRETIAPPAAADNAVIKLGCAHIAWGTLSRRPDVVQRGRDILGYVGEELVGIRVNRFWRKADVRIDIRNDRDVRCVNVHMGKTQLMMTFVDNIFSKTIRRLWRAIKRFYYGRWGITISDKALHEGVPTWIRIIPRPEGHGINFIRVDLPRPWVPIRAIVGHMGRDRVRRTDLNNRGRNIGLTEHLLAAMAMLNIRNADIYVNGPAIPIFDGSARLLVDYLKPLENWSLPPPPVELKHPVAFVRRDVDPGTGEVTLKTVALMLPLKPGEKPSFTFVGDYPNQKMPMEAHQVVNAADPGEIQAIGSPNPTFLERVMGVIREEGRRKGTPMYEGGVLYKMNEWNDPRRHEHDNKPNVIDMSKPENWTSANLLLLLARHKGIIDGIGDTFLLGLSLGGSVQCHVVFIATGHRDTAEVMAMAETGFQFEFPHNEIVGILERLRAKNKVSEAMQAQILDLIEPFKHTERSDISDEIDSGTLNKLAANIDWAPEEMTRRGSAADAAMLERIRNYLTSNNGTAIRQIAANIATSEIPPKEIARIEVKMTEEFERECVFEVTFARERVTPHDWPRVALVVAKDEGDQVVFDRYFRMRQAALQYNLPVQAIDKAADRRVNHFLRVGEYRRGIFSRQWTSRNYARIAPFRRIDEQPLFVDSHLPLALQWDASDAFFGQDAEIDPSQRNFVAKAMGEMMTAAFLQLRTLREGPAKTVPMSGRLLRFELANDLLYDPIDKKAALGFIRASDAAGDSDLVRVEVFLDEILHMKHTVSIDSIPKRHAAARSRIEKHWEPFALCVGSVLDGVQEELEAVFGKEAGQAAMLTWLRRYKAWLEGRNKLHGSTDPRVTTRFREMKVTVDSSKAPEETRNVIGVDVTETVKNMIEGLENPNPPTQVFGSVRWISSLLQFSLGVSPERAVRLAYLSEAIVYGVFGLSVAAACLSAGMATPWLAYGVGGLTSLFLWRWSHGVVLTGYEQRFAWTAFTSLESTLRRRIWTLGVLVAFIPSVAYAAAGLPLMVTVVGFVAVLHRHMNPKPAGSGWIVGSNPVLDERQDARRRLNSQV